MVSRLFFVSFYTHGRYQTFQIEGIFSSILSIMSNFTKIDNLISHVFNLRCHQKQKVLPPPCNFENILVQFSQVITVNASMFWKREGNWTKGEKYEAIYVWRASTFDAPFSRCKMRSYPICIPITYQSSMYESI